MSKLQLTATDILRSRLNQETARLPFAELFRHFAAGSVVLVADGLDLVEVAVQFSQDNKTQVAQWMESGKIARASDQDAQKWVDQAQELWAVVVSPWVLVQENKASA
ncbi:MAG: DUF2288 domain-containing protein [Burkholderiales bacterium]|nr:DUF2288 domain-containing protein [Burkholderiales bacterium]